MGMHHKTPKLSVVDSRGLLIRSVDYWRAVVNLPSEARINRTAHDAAGHPIKQWDPRLWALQDEDPLTPANSTTVHSLSGNALCTVSVDAGLQLSLRGLGDEILQAWDSRGTRREVEYDDLLRPVAVFEQGLTEPRRSVERMAYGGPDHREQNQCGQLIRHDDPAGTVLFEAFSIIGQCVKQVRHFTLDPVTPDWPELEADRQRLLEPGEGAVSTWSFGPLGDVLEQVDARENRQAFSLTLDGRLREARLQLQGLTIWQTLVSDIQYNAQGQVAHEIAGNAVQTALVYRAEDGLLMERRVQDASARLLQHLIYEYDRMGNVLSIEDKALPVRHFANQRIEPLSRFSYDSFYQLIEAFGWEAGSANQGPASMGRVDPAAVSNYRQTYRYDEGGNLLKLAHVGAQGPGRELKAARYSNRCLPWRNGVPPTEEEIAAAFDARGNLLALDQGRFLTWDLRNQLQSVSPVERVSGINDQEFYVYDGGGQRVRKIRSLNTNARTVVAEVRYLPGLELRTDSGMGEVLQVITAQAGLNSVRVWHWETDPSSGVPKNQYRYNLVDHLNSCTLELADDARIISQEIYYPFGETAWFAGTGVVEASYKTIRYSGKERDATGLYYYGLRYYAPWLQRWLNPDPKGFVDGPNLYQMVGNSPMTYVDSDGGGKTETSELNEGLDKQQTLVSSVGGAVSDLKNSILNHAYPLHRFKALGRRVVTQLASSAVSATGKAVGAAAGGGLGGLIAGGAGVALGAKVGAVVGSKAADALISKVVDTYQLERPINFKGNEMNPKAFIESVEPKKKLSLATAKLELAAVDPRTSEGRKQLGGKIITAVVDKVVEKVGSKLGSQAPGLIKTSREFYHASQGLNATSLSGAYDEIPAVIDMLEFRMQAIKIEFASSGSADPETFEKVAEVSTQTQAVVQTLNRQQDFIELVAPKPYAGRRQSLNETSKSAHG
ncbi:RHS repeat domain-containing protein [Pseudomonas mandelii]|uniref:RHS repeat domain-containing protein n=1 Tax=Pseudomonas mandelii TaxID=75612 RepID=UPI00209E450E|nr:RHS repeat-associated core domain-containing protein [Pseudomonas mandelii]MCO8313724.1 RHS repeat-associated core domain-containing protein [Pseudomonas mandelii]